MMDNNNQYRNVQPSTQPQQPRSAQYPSQAQKSSAVIQPQRPVQQASFTPPSQPRPALHFLDKRLIIPLAVIVLILVGIGIYLWLQTPAETEGVLPIVTEVTPELVPVEQPEEPPVLLETDEMVFLERDIISFHCDSISNGSAYAKDACYMAVANETSDLWYCWQMEHKVGDISTDTCLYWVGTYMQNEEVCNLMEKQVGEFSADHCYMDIAKSTNNSILCSRIADTGNYSRKACLDQFGIVEDQFLIENGLKKTVEDCKGLDGFDVGLCLMGLALDTQNISVCEEISQVSGDGSKERCYHDYGISFDEPSACSLIVEDVASKDSCFDLVAYGLLNNTYCNSIAGINPAVTSETCKEAIRFELEGPGYELPDEITLANCNRMQGEGKQVCLLNLASLKSDSEICKLTDNVTKDLCYFNMGTELLDSQYCDMISGDESLKFSCYNYVAVETWDSDLCDLITHPTELVSAEDCRVSVDARGI